MTVNEISTPISDLVNAILASEICSRSFKMSIVTQMFKKGEKLYTTIDQFHLLLLSPRYFKRIFEPDYCVFLKK